MALSLNRTMCVRVLVAVGLVYGSVYLLQHQPAWEVPSTDRAPPLVEPLAEPPKPALTYPEMEADKPWIPSLVEPDVQSDEVNAWKDHNARTHRKLLLCRATGSCTEHQEKVVILQEDDYRKAYFNGPPGGEKIYARSVLTTLETLGVTYFFSLGTTHLSFFYNLYPELIRAVIMNWQHVLACWGGEDEHECLKTSKNPHGAPIQHMFTPDFFGWQGETPFGKDWVLTPESYDKGDTYLGYSIEASCKTKKIRPHAERPRRVWVLAKHSRYFSDSGYPFSNDTFVRASKELNVEFVSGFDIDSDIPPPAGVTNLARDGKMLTQAEFEDALVDTLAIVGIGLPMWSPTPWFGLCWTLPFLNPYVDFGDKTYWSQHPAAFDIGEPHVYNFPKQDDDAFIAALAKAIQPHDSFIPKSMTQPEMNRRTLAWLERDWKGLVEERQKEPEYIEKWGGKDFLL